MNPTTALSLTTARPSRGTLPPSQLESDSVDLWAGPAPGNSGASSGAPPAARRSSLGRFSPWRGSGLGNCHIGLHSSSTEWHWHVLFCATGTLRGKAISAVRPLRASVRWSEATARTARQPPARSSEHLSACINVNQASARPSISSGKRGTASAPRPGHDSGPDIRLLSNFGPWPGEGGGLLLFESLKGRSLRGVVGRARRRHRDSAGGGGARAKGLGAGDLDPGRLREGAVARSLSLWDR